MLDTTRCVKSDFGGQNCGFSHIILSFGYDGISKKSNGRLMATELVSDKMVTRDAYATQVHQPVSG